MPGQHTLIAEPPMQALAPHRATGATAPTPFFAPAVTRVKPGKMHLQAVRDGGRVVDFTWQFCCGTAAHLLNCDPRDLLGKGLNGKVAGLLGQPAMIARYRRVLEQGDVQSFEQVHLLEGRQDLVVHRVKRMGDGVEVTLTNLSAQRRARGNRIEPTQQLTAWPSRLA